MDWPCLVNGFTSMLLEFICGNAGTYGCQILYKWKILLGCRAVSILVYASYHGMNHEGKKKLIIIMIIIIKNWRKAVSHHF